MPLMAVYLMRQLEELSGYASRTIRNYMTKGLVPRPKSAGALTTYDDAVLGRLLLIRLRKKEGMTFYRIKQELSKLTYEELVAVARPPAPLTQAAAQGTNASAGDTLLIAGGARALRVAEKWTRVPLLPGLDLQLADGAAQIVGDIAAEIQRRYQGTSLP